MSNLPIIISTLSLNGDGENQYDSHDTKTQFLQKLICDSWNLRRFYIHNIGFSEGLAFRVPCYKTSWVTVKTVLVRKLKATQHKLFANQPGMWIWVWLR